MSFSDNIAARGGLRGWWRQHGGRSLAGKIYLPVEPATKPEGLAVAAAAHPSDSKNLPAPGATPGSGNLTERGCVTDQPQHGAKTTNRERAAADAAPTAALRPTVAKLGLRYER